MTIKDVFIREIIDYRGDKTIEVTVAGDGDLSASTQIPSGKSRGRNEAAVFSPSEAEEIAQRMIKPNLAGRKFESIGELDSLLISLDGTLRKETLGGNLTLGISLSFARLIGKERKWELWRVLSDEFFGGEAGGEKPLIFSNLINGGVHAKNNLNIQEYMAVVKTPASFGASIARLKDFYAALGKYLKDEFKTGELALGDEGGYSLKFKDNFEPIACLAKMIKKEKLAGSFSIALDAAASEFYSEHRYGFGGSELTMGELLEIYRTYLGSEPLLVSIEDPFAETDMLGFKRLMSSVGNRALVVGDDLTTTDPANIEKAAREKLISGVIIKPNQIGTVTETCEAIKTAKINGMKTIISHRSGETEDPFLIHFAKAGGAYGVKIGAPVPSRLSKYRELERIYD